jgi:uncharacterized protein (TIGR03435 family)
VFLILNGGALAQTNARPKFEVASIKPAAPNAQGTSVRPGPGGGVNVINMTLKQLMAIAFGVQAFQISGGPSWLDSVHYDIIAKPETKPEQDEIPPMIQSLLEERFQLAIHREVKELPVYALVLARKDGNLGSNLVESKEGSCTPMDPSSPLPQPINLGRSGRGGNTATTRLCGWMLMSGPSLEAIGIPLASMLPMLSRHLGRPVIDKTGLEGKFDISVDWGPGGGSARAGRGGRGEAPTVGAAVDTSIFVAFQEQLGLKLESQKGPGEIIVVDRVQRPSEN